MIRFFSKARQKVLQENRVTRYVAYALGEIVLVVIGILIALKVNSWDSDQKTKKELQQYQEKIVLELEENLTYLNQSIVFHDSLVDQQKTTLRILRNKNKDSLPLLQKTLGATATAYPIDYLKFPIIDEFVKRNLLKEIETDSTKQYFLILEGFRDDLSLRSRFLEAQYLNNIEPYYIKHLDYSQIAQESFGKAINPGDSPQDYGFLVDNLEFKNIVTLKYETLFYEQMILEAFKDFLENMIAHLKKALGEP